MRSIANFVTDQMIVPYNLQIHAPCVKPLTCHLADHWAVQGKTGRVQPIGKGNSIDCEKREEPGAMSRDIRPFIQSRPGKVMCWYVNSDQHTTRVDHARIECVTITATQHPLSGQHFPVVRRLRRDGEDQVVIRHPSGATQLLPRRVTSDTTLPASDDVGPRLSLASVRGLLALLTDLAGRSTLPQERSHDSRTAAPALDHLQPPGPTGPDAPVDRPLAPPHPSPAHPRRRREP